MNGTFDLNGFNENINVLTGTGKITNSASGRLSTLGIGANGTGLKFDGLIENGAGILAITKLGLADAVLTGTNTYTGPTTLAAGSLTISADANIGQAPGAATPGSIVFSGGTLRTTTDFTLNANRGMLFNSSSLPAQFDVSAGTTLTYGGVATGIGGLIKNASTGTLVLAGASNFQGNVAVQAGTLVLSGGNDRLPPLTTLTLGQSTNSGRVQLGDAASPISQAIAVLATSGSGTTNRIAGGNASNSTLSVGSGSPSIFLGGTGVENNLNLVKIGAGTLTLTTNCSFTGSTTVDQGTLAVNGLFATTSLVIGNNGVFSLTGSTTPRLSGAPTVTFKGGTLGYIVNSGSETFGTATFQSGLSTIRIQTNSSSTALNFAGTVSTVGSAGLNFDKGAGGTTPKLFFGGYAADVASVAGTTYNHVPAKYDFTGGTGIVAATNGVTTTNGAGTDWGTAANWTNGVPDSTTTAVLRHSMLANGAFTAAGLVMNTNGVAVGGSGSVTILTNGIRTTSSVSVSLSPSGGIAADQVGVDSLSTLVISSPFSSAGLIKSLPGMLRLSNTTTLAPGGNIAIIGGTLQADTPLSLGAAPAVFQSNYLTFDGGTLSTSTAGYGLDSRQGLTLNGPGTLNTAANLTIPGIITGLGSLIKTGTSVLTLTGASNYSGTTSIQAGTLVASGGNDRLPTTTEVILGTATAGTLQLGDASAAINQTVAGIRLGTSATNTSRITGGFTTPSVLTVNVGGTGSFGGTLGGSSGNQAQLALTKAGPGRLELTSANAAIGITTVNAGILSVDNSTGQIVSDITINSGGTLLLGSGTNTVGNTSQIIVNAGGLLDVRSSETIGQLSGAGTLTNNGSATATLIFGDASNATFSGTYQDGTAPLNLIKAGAGNFSMSGTIQSRGTITANAGSFTLDNQSSLENVLIVTGGNIVFNQTTNAMTSVASLQGVAGSYIKTGAQSITLNGFSNFGTSATFSFNGGTVNAPRIGDSPNASSLGYGKLIFAGGTLCYTGAEAANTARLIDATNASGGSLLISAGDLTLGGAITGSAASILNKLGTSKLILNSSTNNTGLRLQAYAGETVLNKSGLANAVTEITGISAGATVRLLNPSFPGPDQIANTGGVTNIFGTFDLNGSSETIDYLSGPSTGTIVNNGSTTSTLTVGGGNSTFTYDGLLTDGTGGHILALKKTGTGTVTLTNSNTFTGGLTIDNGTFEMGSTGALNLAAPNAVTYANNGNTRTLSLNGFDLLTPMLSSTSLSGSSVMRNGASADATFTISNSTNSSFNGVLADGAAGKLKFQKSGSANFTLTGNNTFTGGVTIENGEFTVQSAGAMNATTPNTLAFSSNTNTKTFSLSSASLTIAGLITGPILGTTTVRSTGAPSTLTIQSGFNTDFGGVFSGILSVVKSGTGSLTLSGNNTYSGTVTIENGELVVGNAGALNSTNPVDLSFGNNANAKTLTLNGISIAVKSLNSAVASATIRNKHPTADATLTLTGFTDCSFAGSMQDGSGGKLAFAKTGSASLTLSGNSSFTGDVNISNNNVYVQSSNNTLNPIVSALGNPQASRSIILGNNANLNFDVSDAFGNSSSVPIMTIVLNGGGLQNVGAISETLGPVQMSAGTVIGSYRFAGPLWVTGSLQSNIFALDSAGRISFNPGTTVTVDDTTGDEQTDLLIDTTIENTPSSPTQILKSGTGTVTIYSDNTFTGGVTIDNGEVRIGDSGNLNNTTPNAVTFGSNTNTKVLALNGSSITVSNLITGATLGTSIVRNGGSGVPAYLTLDNNVDCTFSGVIEDGAGSQSLALVKTGPARLYIDGNNNAFSGGLFIDNGDVFLTQPGAMWTAAPSGISFSSNTNTKRLYLNYDTTVAYLETGTPLGVSSIINNSSSPVTLTIYGAFFQTFEGTITANTPASWPNLIMRGYYQYMGGANDLSSVNIDDGELILTSNTGLGTNVPLSFGDNNNFKTLTLNGFSPTFSSLTTGATVDFASIRNGGTTPATLTVNNSANITYGGTLDDGFVAPLSITKTGTGTLTLAGMDTLTGTVLIDNGEIRMGNSNALGIIAFGSNLNSKLLTLDGYNLAVAGLSTGAVVGTALVRNNNAATAATLTVNGTSNDTFAGTIQNGGTAALSLVKSGSGSLALSAANSFSGSVYIDGGTLLVNGTLTGGGTVTVDGGTLSGSGTISGPVAATSVGTVNPFAVGTAGTLTVLNSATIAGVCKFDVDGATADKLFLDAGIGNVSIAAGSKISFNTITAPTQATYNLIACGGARTGTFATESSVPAGYVVRYGPNNVELHRVPHVTSVTSTTANGLYGIGATINVTVNFSEAVTLTGGNLNVTLDTGALISIPPFINASSVSADYIVGTGENSPDLDSTSIALTAGATLRNPGSEDALVTIPSGQSLKDLKAIVVDTVFPAITNITSSTANGPYTVGAAIDVTVNFSEAVTLAGGNLVVTLDTGAAVTLAPFSGTSATGTYTVAAGQKSGDLNSVSAALGTGATLRDAAGNNAILTIPAGQSLKDLKAIAIDTLSPAITKISSSTANGFYGAGASINITVNVSEPVTLAGGNLVVTLDSGATVTIAPFSGTSVTGTYTVAAGENSADLDSVSATLEIGATLRDAAGNNTVLTIPAGQSMKDLKAIVVDTLPPTITSITSSTANGFYGAGTAINVTINFSEAVTLTGGNMTVTLDTGAVVTFAPFSGSSGTGTYTVALGQNSADLNSVSAAVGTGATLRDSVGNITVLTIPNGQSLKDLKAIVIDTISPAITNITSSTADGVYTVGAAINVTINFSEPVTLTGGNMTVTLSTGVTVIFTPFTGSTASGTYTVAAGQNSADLDSLSAALGAGATLRDAAGNNTVRTIPAGQSLKDSKAIVIDTLAPVLTNITSSTANGPYTVGASINVTANFSEAVTLTGGNMTVTLDTGATVTIAPFAGTSATGTYTVATGENSADLDSISIALETGATLCDAAGNNTLLTIPAGHSLKNLNAITIDTLSPAITNITSSTADGAYKVGSDIGVTVNFSEAVTLTGGNLLVTLDTGATVTLAPFSGSTASGTYTVAAGENSADLDSVSAALGTGATLRDAAGNDTVLTIPASQSLKDLKAIVLDTVSPALTSITSSTADGLYTVAAAISVTVNFSEAVTLAGGTLVVTLDTGATVTIAPFSGASATGTYTVVAGENTADLDSVSVALGTGAILRDTAGNNTVLTIPVGQSLKDSKAIVLDTISPTVTVEQATAQADPTFSGPIVFTVTFSKPVTGFDAADVVLGGTAGAATATLTGSGAAYTVTVSGMKHLGTVTAAIVAGSAVDAAGNSNTASTSVDNRVDFSPLTIMSGPTANPISGVVGIAIKFAFIVNLEGSTVSWTFGDGTTGMGAATSHAYLAVGTYNVTATAINAAGGQTVTGSISVGVAPSSHPTIDTNGDGILTNMDVDSDGDGFPDEIENAVGTSPLNAGETPFENQPKGPVRPINLTSKRISLNLSKEGNDLLMLVGTLPVPAGFVPTGKMVVFDIAGQISTFVLKQNGSATSGSGRFQLKIKRQKTPADQNAQFSLKTKKDNLHQRLANSSPLDGNGLATQMTVVLMFNNTYFQSVLPLSFQGKSSKWSSK